MGRATVGVPRFCIQINEFAFRDSGHEKLDENHETAKVTLLSHKKCHEEDRLSFSHASYT